MEQKLAESEAKYRYLVEYQSEMVSLAKVDGELLFVNRAYAEHHATTPEEMIGRSLYDFVPTQIRGELAQHMQHVAIVGEAKDIENQVLSPDGKPRWVSWTNKASWMPAAPLPMCRRRGRTFWGMRWRTLMAAASTISSIRRMRNPSVPSFVR